MICKINGKALTKYCRKNYRIFKNAKDIFEKTGNVEEVKNYVDNELKNIKHQWADCHKSSDMDLNWAREKVKQSGLKKSFIAEKIGYSSVMFGKILSGKTKPSFEFEKKFKKFIKRY